MGADRHIVIYDLKKIRKEVTKEQLDKITCCVVYIQEMNGEEYLTEYIGDNLYYDAQDWSCVYGYEDADITKKEFDSIWEKINKHRITRWEVWT